MATLYVFHHNTMIDSICESETFAMRAEGYFNRNKTSISLVTIFAPTLNEAWAKLDVMLDLAWGQNNVSMAQASGEAEALWRN